MASAQAAIQDGQAVAPMPGPPAAFRWTVLLTLSLVDAARVYVFDSIGPLAHLLAVQIHFTNANIGLLQSLSSLPSPFMVLVGGVIVDRVGANRAATLFASVCLLGTVVTALGPDLWVMLMGRLVFGLGSGSLSVAVTAGLARWLRGSRINFLFGFSLTLSRLGSLLAQTGPAWLPRAYLWWRTPLLICVLAGTLSLLGAAGCWLLENHARPAYGMEPEAKNPTLPRGRSIRFGSSFWLIILISSTFYAGIFPFQTFAQKLFIEAHGRSAHQASVLAALPTLIALLASPLFGFLVDRTGWRIQWLVLGCAILAPVYLLLGYSSLDPFLLMTLMGLAFTIVPTVVYPAVMTLVPPEHHGKAFGLMTMAIGGGLAGANWLVGLASDLCGAGEGHAGGYRAALWLFSALVLTGFAAALLLWRKFSCFRR